MPFHAHAAELDCCTSGGSYNYFYAPTRIKLISSPIILIKIILEKINQVPTHIIKVLIINRFFIVIIITLHYKYCSHTS